MSVTRLVVRARIGTHLKRDGAAASRRVPLDELADVPDATEVEDAALLRVATSG
jgi:hypothetical protein